MYQTHGNQAQNNFMGHTIQSAAERASERIKPSSVSGDLSPILERISLLADEISHAHANMSALEDKLQPVLAPIPADCSEASESNEACALETRLAAMYSQVRGLNARITSLRNELRI